MSLVVSSNIAGMNSARSLGIADRQLTSSVERLSSGFRINRAADDASGLAISEGLRTQIGSLKVALRNTQDGISVLQTAEGALTEAQGILHRMRDLSVLAANAGGLDDAARGNIQIELAGLASELDRIGQTTTSNGQKLLDGSYRTTFQVGADVGQTIGLSISSALHSHGLGVAGVDVTTAGRWSSAPGASTPTLGQVALTTAAGDGAVPGTTGSAAILTFTRPTGGADFSGAAAGVSAYTDLDGVITFAGRSFDLASVSYDPGVDTDGSGSSDSADLLAQLNDAATTALGLSTPPFVTPPATDVLHFVVSDPVPGATGAAGTPLSTTPGDLAAATPRFTGGGPQAAITSIDAAIEQISEVRGELGAVQNRLEHNLAKLGTAIDNTAASESRIRDTDMATEMTTFSRTSILTQAGTAMLAQAKQTPQRVLQLLS